MRKKYLDFEEVIRMSRDELEKELKVDLCLEDVYVDYSGFL